MTANCTKSNFIVFHSKQLIPPPLLTGETQPQLKKQTSSLGIIIDCNLKFTSQIAKAKNVINSKRCLLKPFVHSGQSICATKKILCAIIIPTAYYLAHLWGFTHTLSIYQQLKGMLHVPFHPAAESLHIFAQILPSPLIYTKARLSVARQMIKSHDLI